MLFRVITSALSTKLRAVIYAKYFDKKEYILETRLGREKPLLYRMREKSTMLSYVTTFSYMVAKEL